MSDKYKNYGKRDEEEEEPETLTIKERRERHRERHPFDLVSFGEEPIPKQTKVGPGKRIPTHPTPLLARNDNALLEADKTALMGLSIREVRSMCKHFYNTFMEVRDITSEDKSKGILPIDDDAEVIHEAKGAGRGKEAFVDWLIRYDAYYRAIQKERQLTHDMGQTLLG